MSKSSTQKQLYVETKQPFRHISLYVSKLQTIPIRKDHFDLVKGIKPCRYEDRQAIFQSLQAEEVDLEKVFLVCIREELEAWLIADDRAIAAMLQPLKHPHPVSRIPKFPHPDRIRNPKIRLTRIFTQELGPHRRYADYRHALLIVREISDFNRIRRSDSFQRFSLKVVGMEL